MAYHIESPGEWPLGVYQIAVTDPVLGGSDGPPNVMGRSLANRALYQRLRGVTPWSAALAADHGYPAKACVMHGGVSWRAILDNNVAPGTDVTKWERWGYSASELEAYIDGVLAASVLASIQFSVLADSTGEVPGASYTTGQTGSIDVVTNIANASATKRLRIMVITASMRLWNKGGNTAVLQASGQVSFGGGFSTVSNSGSTSPNDDKNGASQFTAGVVHTLEPLASVNVTNRVFWAINSGGAITAGNTLLTSNVLIARFELP